MILAATMAGHDPAARTLFDGLWRYALRFPSRNNRRSMSWKVLASGQIAGGCTSAFDGDADMAYALLLADAPWGSRGTIDYAAAYRRLIVGVRASTIGPRSRLPLLGGWVDPDDGGQSGEWTPRTSDMMPGHFRAFGRTRLATPGEAAFWGSVIAAGGEVVETLQDRYAPKTGLLPDFAQPRGGNERASRPAAPGFLEGPHDGHYFYNAGRVPWRLGVDGLLNGNSRSAAQTLCLGRRARKETSGRPRAIGAGYRLDGTTWSADPDYFSTFFVAPFAVAARLDRDGLARLNAIYDATIGETQGYCEDTVTLLSLLVAIGAFWDPTRQRASPLGGATSPAVEWATTRRSRQRKALPDVPRPAARNQSWPALGRRPPPPGRRRPRQHLPS